MVVNGCKSTYVALTHTYMYYMYFLTDRERQARPATASGRCKSSTARIPLVMHSVDVGISRACLAGTLLQPLLLDHTRNARHTAWRLRGECRL